MNNNTRIYWQRILIILTCFYGYFSLTAHGAIFRVNNNLPENITNRLFNQIQTALNHFSVVNGDTIMVEGSSLPYNGFNCSKRVIIIGPGYFLNENLGINALTTNARINDYCFFNNGSQGSFLIGMEINNYRMRIQTSNIYIIRCKVEVSFYGDAGNIVNNCKIIGSYINYIQGYSSLYNNNISVINSIIVQDESGLNYLNYDNNNLIGNFLWKITASTFRNNILVHRDATVNIIAQTNQNNLAPNQQFGTANGNIAYEPGNTFVGGTSTDGKYVIKAGSPYLTAGTNASQPGIFGGSEPYKLSGLPPIPIIYELTVPETGSTTQGLNISLKIRNAN